MASDIDKILKENEGLVKSILKKCLYIKVDKNIYDALLNAGRNGLIRASKDFDPTLGFKFSSYAYKFIEGEIKAQLRKYFPKDDLISVVDDTHNIEIDERMDLESSIISDQEISISDVLLELNTLSTKSRNIIKMTYGLTPYKREMSPDEISYKLGITKEEANSLCGKALEFISKITSDKLKKEKKELDSVKQNTNQIPGQVDPDNDIYDKNMGLIEGSKIFFQYFPKEAFKITRIIEQGESKEFDFIAYGPVANVTMQGTTAIVEPIENIDKMDIKRRFIIFLNHLEQFKIGKKNKKRMFWKEESVRNELFLDDINMKAFVKYHANKLMKFEMKNFLRALGINKNSVRMYTGDINIKFKIDPTRAVFDRFDEYIDQTGIYYVKFDELENKLNTTKEEILEMDRKGLIKYPYDINEDSKDDINKDSYSLVRLR